MNYLYKLKKLIEAFRKRKKKTKTKTKKQNLNDAFLKFHFLI